MTMLYSLTKKQTQKEQDIHLMQEAQMESLKHTYFTMGAFAGVNIFIELCNITNPPAIEITEFIPEIDKIYDAKEKEKEQIEQIEQIEKNES
jgi:hypothetical protein